MPLRDKRESGILLAVSSLPSRYGIGTFGEEAYRFVDFLARTRQRYWQILPLVPLGEGNSPYKSCSCFAGEILYIDLDFLVRDGLLSKEELPTEEFSPSVDYGAVRQVKLPLLEKAVRRFDSSNADYRRFVRNADWLEDYALYRTICDETGGGLTDFEDELKYRVPAYLADFRQTHAPAIRFYKVTQYLFYVQYAALREYAAKSGIGIIGDIPYYIALDSADVWTAPDNFRLGRDLTPVRVAGVPPDIFSEAGQLWGNPIYDWDFQKKSRYSWWKKRLAHCAALYDVLRIDHFRAFADYYSIPYGADDARGGVWETGPGIGFWETVRPALGKLRIIAEDLGGENDPEVLKLVRHTGFPNMKVLEFAWDGDPKNPFLPRNFGRNCVCYTGTHDNMTVLDWYNKATMTERLLFTKTAPDPGKEIPLRMIGLGMRSKASVMIVPMQDWLCLGEDARMNTPGTLHGNWSWRMPQNALGKELETTVRNLTRYRHKFLF